jgi:hypothetical protein
MSRPGIPTQLRASVRLWLLAIAAGLVETALAVIEATSGQVGSVAWLVPIQRRLVAAGATTPPADLALACFALAVVATLA